MKKVYRLFGIIISAIIAVTGFLPVAAHSTKAQKFIDGIIEYNLKSSSSDSVQEWIDKDMTNHAGLGSEWYIMALADYGNYDFSKYKTALSTYLSEAEITSASSRLKFALVLIAIGDKTNPYITESVKNSIGEQGIMSIIFGLHILNNGIKSTAHSESLLINELISLQHDDGGWSVTGNFSDVDVTAMTIQALACHYKTNSKVRKSVDKAVDFISKQQSENGGFSSYGLNNPESTAQVIIALSSLGIDICKDERFIKNGKTVFDSIELFCLSDGSFSHKENGNSDSTATSQVFCASIAYKNMLNKKSDFYIFDTAETTIKPITKPETSITETTTKICTSAAETEITTEEEKADRSVSPIIISVCVISAILCIALLVAKKCKTAVIILIITATAFAGFLSIQNEKKIIGYVTVSINCDVIKEAKQNHIPKSGIILEETRVEIQDGDTVYDVLSKICKENNILFSPVGFGELVYIEGIGNIYEMDFGKSSGWLYFVNNECPAVGCGNYILTDGDFIEWRYTLNPYADLDNTPER